MATSARSVWKGFIRFALVSIPVKAYTAAASGGGAITLNQLHRDCKTRIKYQKTCPQHGEVQAGDIVSGYQYAPDQYVIVDASELEKIRTPKEKAVDIQAFIKPDAIDPVFFSGRTLYLVPDGPIGFKPYTLLLKAMNEQDRFAFAKVVMTGKDQLVLLRPAAGLIAMSFLSFATEVRPATEFTSEVPTADATAEELKLARMITDTMATDDFDFASYKDTYNDRLRDLIQSKIEGKEIVSAASEDLQPAPDLMAALRESLATAKTTKRPAKLAAPTKPAKADAAGRKRKSS
jgi:DNA end-binding protein Ku